MSHKRTWSDEEDALLSELVEQYGTKNWSIIGESMDGRTGKQCRERYHNHLQEGIRKGEWTEEEDRIIISMQAKIGNQWAVITKHLPGRTDNAVKNRWHAANRLQNRLLSLDALPASAKADAARGAVTVIKANMAMPRPNTAFTTYTHPTANANADAFNSRGTASRRHPLVPSLQLAGVSSSAINLTLSAAILDLKIHEHDHSHDHDPISNRSDCTSEAPSSSRGSSAHKYYFEVKPSPFDSHSLDNTPRIDMIAMATMDDEYINACLPCHRYFAAGGQQSQSQSRQSTARDSMDIHASGYEFGLGFGLASYRDPLGSSLGSNGTTSSDGESSASDSASCSASVDAHVDAQGFAQGGPRSPTCGLTGAFNDFFAGDRVEEVEDCQLMQELFVIHELDVEEEANTMPGGLGASASLGKLHKHGIRDYRGHTQKGGALVQVDVAAPVGSSDADGAPPTISVPPLPLAAKVPPLPLHSSSVSSEDKKGKGQQIIHKGLSPRTTPRSPACPQHHKRSRYISPRLA